MLSDSYVEAITVDGDVVYCAGHTGTVTDHHACYWVNSVKYDLETALASDAEFIRVDGADVYVVGTCNVGGTYVTRLWHSQNNSVPACTDFSVTGSSVFIEGTDVYVAGSSGNSVNNAFYSKNGGLMQICPGPQIYSVRLFVDGTDVYTAGDIYDSYPGAPYYWKNANRVDLPGRGEITAITANSTGVYTIGTRKDTYDPTIAGKDYAILWHNTDMFVLPATDAVPYAIQMANEDVYAVGHASDGQAQTACCWINGTMTILPHPSGTTANAVSVFVKLR